MCVERDAGVIAQTIRSIHQTAQAATRHHIDIRRAFQIARAIGVEAVAVTFHAMGIGAQRGRQILSGGQIRLARLVVEQPDPAGAQIEQRGDLRQRRVQRLVEVHRLIERPRHRHQDRKLAVAPPQLFCARRATLVLGHVIAPGPLRIAYWLRLHPTAITGSDASAH